nr:hypothetical protein [Tanacetum cinerariifolium]
MMIYLKNTAGYKLDFFKGMSYDEIRPIFQARFDANMRFLFKSREEMEEEDQELLELMLSKRSRKNTNCVNAADEELAAAKHKLMFLLVLPLCLLQTFCPRSNLECKYAIKRQRQEECIVNAIRSRGMLGGSMQLLRATLVEYYTNLLDFNDEDLDLGEQNISSTAPSLPHIPIDHHPLIAPSTMVLDRIKSFLHVASCRRDGLHAQHLMDCLSGADVVISDALVSSITQVMNLFLVENCPQMWGEYIASALLTSLVKSRGDDYLDGLQFGVRVSRGSEAILYVVNRLIEGYGDDVGLSMLLVDFKNTFNLVDREVMLREVHLRCPTVSRWVEFCNSNPSILYYGEHALCSCQGVQ